MTISADTFAINIRHTYPDEVSVLITDRITGLYVGDIVKVKELNLDKLEQALIEKLRIRKAKLREDWGSLYRLGKDSNITNPWHILDSTNDNK